MGNFDVVKMCVLRKYIEKRVTIIAWRLYFYPAIILLAILLFKCTPLASKTNGFNPI